MKKRKFVLRGFNSAERICSSAGAKLQTGETSQYFPSPLAKFRTADKPASGSRNRGSEVMTGAGAKEFQDAGKRAGVRGNKAFTLAEVLITLVIIGVIGALTVPALIQNTQKQEYVTALKKTYSALSQAALAIIAEKGSPKCSDGGWACSSEDIYNQFKQHLNSAKECPQKGCFDYESVYYLNNKNNKWGGLNTYGRNKLVLADGTTLLFMHTDNDCKAAGTGGIGSKDICGYVYIDINGSKKPNMIGRDFFIVVLKENGMYPSGCDQGAACGELHGDWNCACKVLTENAMNY